MASPYFLYLVLWAGAWIAVIALSIYLATVAITSTFERFARSQGDLDRDRRRTRLPQTLIRPLYIGSAAALIYGLVLFSAFPPEDSGLMLASVVPFVGLAVLLFVTGLLTHRCASSRSGGLVDAADP